MDVLLLHDGNQNLEAIRDALLEDDLEIVATESTSTAVATIEQAGNAAILLAIASLDDVRVDLARGMRQELGHDGALLLLCRGRYAEDAYHLCRSGVFDDYVTVEPLYDAFRLRLAVYRAGIARRSDKAQVALTSLGQGVAGVRSSLSEESADLSNDATRVLELVMATLQQNRPPGLNRHTPSIAAQDQVVIDQFKALTERQANLFATIEDQLHGLEQNVRKARTPDENLLLMVDDDPSAYELLQEIVSPMGFKVAWTGDPTQALQFAKDVRPFAVLLDVEMPLMSGLEVLKAIRNDPSVSDLPVFLLTGRRDRDTVVSAAHLDIAGYIAKPPQRADLEERLSKLAGV